MSNAESPEIDLKRLRDLSYLPSVRLPRRRLPVVVAVREVDGGHEVEAGEGVQGVRGVAVATAVNAALGQLLQEDLKVIRRELQKL